MNKSNQLTEGAILTAIFSVLLLASFLIPLLGSFILFLLPIPFVIYTNKHGWKPALIMAMVAFLIGLILVSIISIPFILVSVIAGITIGNGLHQKRTSYEILTQGTAGIAIAFVLTLLFSQVAFDFDYSSEFDKQMDQVMAQSEQVIESLGLDDESGEQLEIVKDQMGMLKGLLPFGIVLIAVVYAFIIQWLSYKVMNRLEKRHYYFPPFRELLFPSAILWIYLVTLIVSLFQPEPTGMVFLITQNVALLTGMLLILQGLSFVFYYTHKKKLSIGLPIVVIIFAVLFSPVAFPLIRILGIVDIGFKLRERMSQDKK